MTESTILLNQIAEINAGWCDKYWKDKCKGCPAMMGTCIFAVWTELLMSQETWLSQFIQNENTISIYDDDEYYYS